MGNGKMCLQVWDNKIESYFKLSAQQRVYIMALKNNCYMLDLCVALQLLCWKINALHYNSSSYKPFYLICVFATIVYTPIQKKMHSDSVCKTQQRSNDLILRVVNFYSQVL